MSIFAAPRLTRCASALVLVASLTALAGCGSSTGDTATTAAASDDTSAPATTAPASGGDTTAEVTTADPTTTVAEATVIEATVSGGQVDVASDVIEVALDSPVSIRVTTDVAEPIHLHGYDLEVDAEAGVPAQIDFVADVPGKFEVELEDSGTLLFQIQVS